MSPPEFTATCRTEGGPATTVTWRHSDGGLPEDYEESQIILDTSENSVYENRLRVRGRESGIYFFIIGNQLSSTPGAIDIGGVYPGTHYILYLIPT